MSEKITHSRQEMDATDVFKKRAVAFLDILGFKEITKQAEQKPDHLDRLCELRAILDDHVRFNNATLDDTVPDEVKPLYIFISDSIILSVPLRHDKYDGLAIVIIKSIEIAHKLFELGYLLRGGINVRLSLA